MDDPDPSWYLGSYDTAIQTAYSVLREEPLKLEDLHSGPYRSAIDRRIHFGLHALLSEFTESFPTVVERLVPAPIDAMPTGKMVRHVDLRVRCAFLIDQVLSELRSEREEREIMLEALNASLSSVAGSEGIERDTEGHDGSVVLDGGLDEKVYDISDDDEGMEGLFDFTRECTPTPIAPGPRQVSPSKRTGTSSCSDTPLKRIRNEPQGVFGEDDTGATNPRLPTASNFRSIVNMFGQPRIFSRSVSNSTTSTWSRTNSTSTTTSTITTALTTPMTSVPLISSVFSETDNVGWQPKPAKPLAERTVLVVPRNPFQDHMSRLGVHFAVQWELERLINSQTTLTWDDIRLDDLELLAGAVANVMCKLDDVLVRALARSGEGEAEEGLSRYADTAAGATISRRQKMLAEIDHEEVSIARGDLKGVYSSDRDWPYGGKVAYTIIVRPASLRSPDCVVLADVDPLSPGLERSALSRGPAPPVSNKLPFSMTLCPPSMPGKSFRLARRFGSRRVVSFKLKDFNSNADKDRLMELFVGRRFELLGKTYRAIWAPTDNDAVFALEMGCLGQASVQENPSGVQSSPFLRLWSMYNDMMQKPSQAMAKWAARPQLLFSDTIPATQVLPSAIAYDRDIVSSHALSYTLASTEQILTDGCKLMSENLAHRLRIRSDMLRPCVVQMRIGGSKGLLALMSPAQHVHYAGKDLVLRDSMVKALPARHFEDDPSLLTVDVVKYDSLKLGTSLSYEGIVAMAHNGVPASVFVNGMTSGLDDLARAFDPNPAEGETEEDVTRRLVTSCFRLGGVGSERQKREVISSGLSGQVLGVSIDRLNTKKDAEKGAVDDEGSDLIHPSEQYAIDPVSRQPGSLAESLMLAVAAGFHPLRCPYTSAKLNRQMTTLTDTMIRQFRIPIERSLSAFIVPDSQQVLKPDEIFVSFSTRQPIDPETHCPVPYLEGPVLVFRSPCKLPTDVRKFTAVYKPELAHLKDCVVMSANSSLCSRSPASFLGGGDYDGDTVQVFWENRLVEPFENAPDFFADLPAGFVEENFEKDVIKVSEFMDGLQRVEADEEMVITNQQYFLLGGLQDGKSTGNYSDLHGNAVYRLGYSHPETIRLAHMFCHVLDACKSGLRVRPEVKRADHKRYGGSVEWRDWKNQVENSDIIRVKGPKEGAPRFILDVLMDAAKDHRMTIMQRFPAVPAVFSQIDYDDLSKDWLRMESRMESRIKSRKESQDDLPSDLEVQVEKLRKHVEACYTVYTWIRPGNPRRTPVREAYQAFLAGEKTLPKTPGKSKDKTRKETERETGLLRLTQMRRLAEVWADALTVEDVPDLCWEDETRLKRLKVACGTTFETYKPKQIFVFDMDFETTCAMKVAACGGGQSFLACVAGILKPEYKNLGAIE